jgi:pimeloyl-ACP methyl ester carboxylesterase
MMKKRILLGFFLSVFVVTLVQAEDLFFDSNGVKIHYTVQGKGEPVVLIHGYAVSIPLNWSAVMPGLVGDYQVIAIDNRGHGKSEKPHDAASYSPKLMAGDTIHLMDHLKIPKAHIVGYSMGGFITSVILTEHPNRCLTATMGGAGWSSPEERQATSGLLEQLAVSLETGKGIGPLLIGLNPPGAPPPTPEAINSANQMLLAANDPLALAACARGGLAGFQVSEAKIRANKIPVLALIGDQDPLKTGVDRLDGVMPNLKTVVIHGATHMTAPSNPEFLKSLRAFLADHAAPAEGGAANRSSQTGTR